MTIDLWEVAWIVGAADGVKSRDEGGVGAVIDDFAETVLSEASICGIVLELIVISGAP